MNTLDQAFHVLGSLLLISLAVLSLRVQCQRLKLTFTRAFVAVLLVLLADAAMHLLPDAIACFIYGTQKHYVSTNFYE
ncbi:hypothetical protein AU255_02475 [Methyloprofundus sedimenti]|uniref:Uncharacterized protein n=1 Tax=Methyloprofundus sedimenti TaxID=1420851 RepID=A0A1V8M5F9_9GAMM|nr:hypothetical protein [Methyloprofundus sedimenti]OQK16792.1 hypothetical protein AU255_02475 [Methyloprofundus sedimenti]